MAHVKIKTELAVVSSLVLIAACSRSGAPNGNSGPGKLRAEDRWPETGSFAYKLDQNGCRDEKVFSRKSDYCVTLTDHSANHPCTYDLRKNLYRQDCGVDFSATNIPAVYWHGYDTHLERYCATAPAGVVTFPRLDDDCEFLKDENLHRGCFWEKRASEFKGLECPGEFSASPQLTPSPSPSPGPSPTPTFDPRPAIARELEAQGIRVEIRDQININPIPFQDRLEKFWTELEKTKTALVSRKDSIHSVFLSEFVAYDSLQKVLTLSVDLNSAELETYFSLYDRRVRWERNSGIRLDLGVEIYGFESNKTARLNEMLQYFEGRRSAIGRAKPALRSITLGTHSNYSLSRGLLTVRLSDYQDAIDRAVPALAEARTLVEFSNANGITLLGQWSLDGDEDSFAENMRNVNRQLSTLGRLHQLAVLDRLDVSEASDVAMYNELLRTLSLPTRPPGIDSLSSVLKSLALTFQHASELNLPVHFASELNENFVEAASRFERRLAKIRLKRVHLTELVLAETSGYSNGRLEIGYQGTLSDLDRVLDSIN